MNKFVINLIIDLHSTTIKKNSDCELNDLFRKFAVDAS